jgi:hypothetical protein
MKASILIMFLLIIKTALSERGFNPRIVHSIGQVRDPFVEAGEGLPFGQGPSFNDMLVDLNKFYENMESHLEKDRKEKDLFLDYETDDSVFGLKYSDAALAEIMESNDKAKLIKSAEPAGNKIDKREKLQKWNYLPAVPRGKYLTKEKPRPRVLPKKGNEVTEMTVEKSNDLLSDDIFGNWEEPAVVKNLELQKINKKGNTRNIFDAIDTQNNVEKKFVLPKLSGEIMKENTKTKRNWVNKFEGLTSFENEYGDENKSLYSWYRKMKETGRFNV